MKDSDNTERSSRLKRVLAKLGIVFPEKKWLPVTINRRILRAIAGVIVLMIIGSGGFVWVSSKPAFCKICHIQKPYYDSWKTSEHGKRGIHASIAMSLRAWPM